MPTANNQIFGAAGDPQIAIRIHPPQIPRAQVALIMIESVVLGRLGIGVAGKYSGIVNTDFSNLIDIALLKPLWPVTQNFYSCMGQGQTNGSYFFKTFIGVARDQTRRLGQTIPLDNLNTCCGFKALEQFNGQRRRARKRRSKR